MVRVVPLEDASGQALELAVAALAAGGLVILPTDTLYALGCAAQNAAAAQAVRLAKGRDERKPLPLVIADRGQLDRLCSRPPRALAALAERFWPGPLSLVVPADPRVPAAVTSGASTVAVRVPAHDFLRRVCQRVGPVVATSANRAGERPPATCADAVRGVGESAVLAVDGGEGTATPSTLVDLTSEVPRLLRAGAIPWENVTAVLRAATS